MSFTSGIFFYSAVIDQRGDFFDANGTGLYATGATDPIGANLSTLFDFIVPGLIEPQPLNLFSAKERHIAANGKANTGDNASLILGVLHPDPGGELLNVKHGIDTIASDLLYGTRTRRDSVAVYTQGVWDINDTFTLTFGLRWAEDEVAGEENLYRSSTLCAIGICGLTGLFGTTFLGLPNLIDPSSRFFDPNVTTVNNLASYNVLLGTLDPVNLQPTGNGPVLNSIPIALSIHRSFDRTDDKVTGRLNLDWNLNDDSMVYFSVTTGYRGGGFNLVFFSETSSFDPEELISYEIGYKAQLLDNTLQLNSSIYFYDYDTIHTFGTEVSLTGGTTSSVLEAPGAEIKGFEIEGMWLATERITLGGNYSYTKSEYTETLLIRDDGDIRFPSSVIPALDSNLDIKGNQILQVPENKASLWASYNLPLGGNGRVEFLFAASYIDEVFFSQFETEFDRAPSYERYDFRATWKSPSEKWVVTGFVNNILDEIGIRQIETHGETDGFRRTAQVTEPRIYGLEVSYSLGS